MASPTITAYHETPPHNQRRTGGGLIHTPQGPSQPEDSSDGLKSVKITVVTVVFNAEEELEETLRSVLDQGYKNLEYIVIDGASTDRTLGVIQSFEEQLALWISEPDGGIYDAMNKGIAHATGDVVGLLNAGDTYLPGTLQTVAEAYGQNGPQVIYFGDVLMDYLELDLQLPTTASLQALSYTSSLPHPSVFVPRALYERQGLYDLNYRLAADYAFLAAHHFRGTRFLHLAEPLARFTSGGRSGTFRGFLRCRRELATFHRTTGSGYLTKVLLYSAFEMSLLFGRRLLEPLVGQRRADALQKRFFLWRQNRRVSQESATASS